MIQCNSASVEHQSNLSPLTESRGEDADILEVTTEEVTGRYATRDSTHCQLTTPTKCWSCQRPVN